MDPDEYFPSRLNTPEAVKIKTFDYIQSWMNTHYDRTDPAEFAVDVRNLIEMAEAMISWLARQKGD